MAKLISITNVNLNGKWNSDLKLGNLGRGFAVWGRRLGWRSAAGDDGGMLMENPRTLSLKAVQRHTAASIFTRPCRIEQHGCPDGTPIKPNRSAQT
ncbi:hypothetical protein Lal_00041476 [Lupinus albus]|nr:hypothetical protein Lal_00041476 [Lupinus albus]